MINLTTEISYLSSRGSLASACGRHRRSETTSIDPVRFPYHMEKLQGVLLYRDGHVTLEHFKAWHGPVEISTKRSFCDFLPGGGWTMRFDELTAERLRPDRDLIQALPER